MNLTLRYRMQVPRLGKSTFHEKPHCFRISNRPTLRYSTQYSHRAKHVLKPKYSLTSAKEYGGNYRRDAELTPANLWRVQQFRCYKEDLYQPLTISWTCINRCTISASLQVQLFYNFRIIGVQLRNVNERFNSWRPKYSIELVASHKLLNNVFEKHPTACATVTTRTAVCHCHGRIQKQNRPAETAAKMDLWSNIWKCCRKSNRLFPQSQQYLSLCSMILSCLATTTIANATNSSNYIFG